MTLRVYPNKQERMQYLLNGDDITEQKIQPLF